MRRVSAFVPVLLALFLTSCGTGGKPVVDPGQTGVTLTPEQKKDIANKAGAAAALGWLAIQKPDKPTVEAVKVVVDKVRENLAGWKEGGFKATLPGIKEAIAKLFPKEEDKVKRLAAEKLAEALLDELDNLFAKHADWKDKGDEVAGIVGAFLDGSSFVLNDFLVK